MWHGPETTICEAASNKGGMHDEYDEEGYRMNLSAECEISYMCAA